VPPTSITDNIQLALNDPTLTPKRTTHDRNQEPFGLFSFAAPDNIVRFKWRKVVEDIRAQEPALMRCLADEAACSRAEAHFAAIVKEAREHEGRVQFNFVNRRINNAIRYTSDMAQWGTPDEWSAPLADGKGSFETGMGDCEDYAIAKYVALRAAGVPAKYLRILLVRDNIARLDHAVLAANEGGRWFILDNHWTAAVEDNDVHRFTPLLALDDHGVKLLAAPYTSRTEPTSEAVRSIDQKPPASAETAQKQFLQDGIGSLGLRPRIM
jgi:predicted transglutaminase-like cysteine proteinase